jgi:2-(1,2-epoxy-1,2-dihydrophenyl)acetyl-CoA isomerase
MSEHAFSYDTLEVGLADGVLRVALNRPDRLNALNLQIKGELAEVIRFAAAEPEVRCFLLTGNGRGFCAGGDITEMDADRAPAEARRRMRHLLHTLHLPLTRLEKPVVVAVNGLAYGAGISLALTGDLVLAADDAKLSFAFAKVGIIPDSGLMYHLPRLLGMSRAKELLFTGRPFSAQEACELGLVNRVVEASSLQDEAMTLARELAAGPTIAFGLTKTILGQAPTMTFEDMIELESYALSIVTTTADHAEGILAFKEKRSPNFQGR